MAPEWFIAEQVPLSAAGPSATTANNLVVAQQLGNCYFLAFLVAIAVLYSTTELKVVRNYLVALGIADVGHVFLTYRALGHEQAMAVGAWNALTWGNIGATVSPLSLWAPAECIADENWRQVLLVPDPDGVPRWALWPRQTQPCPRCQEDPVMGLFAQL